jgi:trehalose/maltose hydrolase-like predicted phosphorylase
MLPDMLPGAQLQDTLGRTGYAVMVDQLARTAKYYLDRTMHESRLSRMAYAGALARFDPDASWQFYNAALRFDLDPATGGGAAEGIHLGTMAATLDVMQRLYLGLDATLDGLMLSPALPAVLPGTEMRLFYRNNALSLEWTGSELRLRSDPANLGTTMVWHGGQPCALPPGAIETFQAAPKPA